MCLHKTKTVIDMNQWPPITHHILIIISIVHRHNVEWFENSICSQFYCEVKKHSTVDFTSLRMSVSVKRKRGV